MPSLIGSIGKDTTLVGLTVIGGNIMFLAFLVGGAWKVFHKSSPKLRQSIRNRRLRKFRKIAFEYKFAALKRKTGASSLLTGEFAIVDFVSSTIIMFLAAIASVLNVIVSEDDPSW